MAVTHVRGFAETAKDDSAVARFTLQVWPIPYSIVDGLNQHLFAQVNEYLTAQGVVSGEMSNLNKTVFQ